MLSGRQVRVRQARHRLIPQYINPADPNWREVAERLIELFRAQQGQTRAELEEDVRQLLGDQPSQLIHQGLAKLLEDRCEFEVQSGHPPETLREHVFREAAIRRRGEGAAEKGEEAAIRRIAGSRYAQQRGSEPADHAEGAAEKGEEAALAGSVPDELAGFDRSAVLEKVAQELDTTPELIELGLFADLKSEQRLVTFADITAEQLLHRYNVALAQAVLLRATSLEVDVRHETPQRFRQLFRAMKFHRLICDIQPTSEESYRLRLDGPLSLFSATQRYGLQLALFLPTLLQCGNFDLRATVRWGSQRTGKVFLLSSGDGLRSHVPDYGNYVPKELEMFAEQFRKVAQEWQLKAEPAPQALSESIWVPDFQLIHRASGESLYIEVLGFWRRSNVEQQLDCLRQALSGRFILAVSEQYHTEESVESMSEEVYRFKRQPLVDEVIKRAKRLLQLE